MGRTMDRGMKCFFAVIIGIAFLELSLAFHEARGDENKQSPPFAAAMTRKTFDNDQYKAVILGKIIFHRNGKSLASNDEIKVAITRKGSSDSLLFDARNNEGFRLQSMLDQYVIGYVLHGGRRYNLELPFSVSKPRVVFLGILNIRLLGDTPTEYEYEFHIDDTMNSDLFNRNPDLNQLLALSPDQFWTDRNIDLTVPDYRLKTGRLKERKSLPAAAEYGDLDTVTAFLKAGGSVDVRDDQQRTPLMLALRGGHSMIAESLIVKGASLSARNRNGWTPFMYAVRHGSMKDVRLLLKKKADFQAGDNEGWTPLMSALRYDKPEIARELIDRGSQVNARNKDNWTPLMFAIRNNQAENAKLLIRKGADVNVRSNDGWTPLMMALRYGQPELARLLIEQGADLNAKNSTGGSPLLIALHYNQSENAVILIRRGADINVRDASGWSPLMTALRYGQAETARILIEKGAEVDIRNSDGWTPLMIALRNNQAENARRLIQKGADVNARIASGWTPLLLALEFGQPENARLLIQKKADVSAATGNGETALSIARKKGYSEIVRLLGGEPEAVKAPATPGKKLSPVLEPLIPKREDVMVVNADDCKPTAMSCHALLQAGCTKKEAFNFYKAALIRDGWRCDTGESASAEAGSLGQKDIWGLLNFNRGAHTLTMIILSDKKTGGNATRIDVNLMNRAANDGIADFIKGIPKIQVEKPK